MSEINLSDKVSIINYGIGIQHKLADLSQVVSDIVKEKDYSDIKHLTDTLIELMSMDEHKTPLYMDTVIESIKEELIKARFELLKECKLYEELRKTNAVYITQISTEIADGESFIRDLKDKKVSYSDSLSYSELKYRIKELRTTRTVAGTLNEQLSLYQKNSASFAERISSVINSLMPLWESKVALSANKESTQKAFRMLKALVDEI
ncbi:Toxic anion resistance protein (TelA) [Lachnospiraceae bacterium YSD2013]|nr:Toxic anion resistance protein (TelA) [Lachnospiraceae bacterium YSD2013]